MPFLALPIRTETVIRRTPVVNYILIGLNLCAFLAFDARLAGEAWGELPQRYLYLASDRPAFYQFLTYQFMHADTMHLLGNMLFLWVFGNSVNGKMGDGPYLLFYLAGGIFAGLGHALLHPNALVGASGSVAAVTTAYLALFPRSRVTILLWFFLFLHFVEVPAMIVIGLKIIVWDNIIGPALGETQRVAHHAHLAGYLFGFAAALLMLLTRALPRDQFDILALWKRWHRRREFAAVAAGTPSWSSYEAVGREVPLDPQQRAAQERAFEEIADLRVRIGAELAREDDGAATALYEQLTAKSEAQCLSEQQQLAVAREFFRSGRFPQAAAAFERFVQCYPSSSEAGNVRLLLGIVYARDLRQYEDADRHLTQSMHSLRDSVRRDQCLEWLKNVRAALGRPAPEIMSG